MSIGVMERTNHLVEIVDTVFLELHFVIASQLIIIFPYINIINLCKLIILFIYTMYDAFPVYYVKTSLI